MITGTETNIVYFSELIQTNPEYTSAFGRIKHILDKHNISYKFLKGTKDIWCRDYMPIQIDDNKFIQFKYKPSYLDNYTHLQSIPKTVLLENKIKSKFSEINLDGGNIVNTNNKAILTNRIFKENPTLPLTEIIKELEHILNVELLFIPDIPIDMTGHADGYIRFVNENTILVNQLDKEYKYFQKGFLKMVENGNLDYIEMPYFEHKDKSHKNSAIGSYLNYLEIGNLIIFPIFEIENNLDEEALSIIRKSFPDRIIEPVNINEIAKHGGLMNCITWTIKT